jgi:small subunit ribosomal protein S17
MEKITRKLSGLVTSNKMNKTVIVKVEMIKVHPKYHKRYKVFKKYPSHNELEGLNIGDRVVIEEAKPYSKTVHWRVVSKQ